MSEKKYGPNTADRRDDPPCVVHPDLIQDHTDGSE